MVDKFKRALRAQLYRHFNVLKCFTEGIAEPIPSQKRATQ